MWDTHTKVRQDLNGAPQSGWEKAVLDLRLGMVAMASYSDLSQQEYYFVNSGGYSLSNYS